MALYMNTRFKFISTIFWSSVPYAAAPLCPLFRTVYNTHTHIYIYHLWLNPRNNLTYEHLHMASV